VAAAIVGMTTTSTGRDLENFKAAGLDDIMPKPISRDMLRAKVAAAAAYLKSGATAPSLPPLPVANVPHTPLESAPCSTPEAPEPKPAKGVSWEGVEGSKTGAGAGGGGRNVLVCDVDAGQRMVLKKSLGKLGYSVTVCSDGDKVLELVEKAACAGSGLQCILTAVNMPNTSGWDVLAKVRACPQFKELPIVGILATGVTAEVFDAENAAAASKNRGFSASVQKPLDMHKVDALLGRLCGAGVAAVGGGGGGGGGVGRGGEEQGIPTKMQGTPSKIVRETSRREKGSLRILVVEDHWANQKLLEAMLKQRGHEVRCSENGLEAVNLTLSEEFDLVLMDCNMPVLDGFEATERIRARKGPNDKVPIIAVTANAMKGDRDKCMAAGMDDYITKPVQRQKLHEMIAKWTGIEASTPSASSSPTTKSSGIVSPMPAASPVAAPPRARPQKSMVMRSNSSSTASAVKPRILLVSVCAREGGRDEGREEEGEDRERTERGVGREDITLQLLLEMISRVCV